MTDTIIVAVLSLVGTLAGAWLANRKSAALFTYQLEQLKTQVEKHNKVIERMAIAERNIDTAFERIDELREEVHAHHPYNKN